MCMGDIVTNDELILDLPDALISSLCAATERDGMKFMIQLL